MTEYKLQDPVEYAGETVTTLKFREPKAKDIRNLPLNPKFGDILDVAMKLSGQTTPFMDQLSTRDATEVVAIVGELL